MKNKIVSLSKNEDFKSILSGKKISNKYLTIFFKKLSDKNNNRLNISFVAKKKIGNAVTRNRIKRRLRNIMNEAVKSININLNYCYLLIARISVSKDPYDKIKIATEKDWRTEYLSPIISVKSVNGVKEAISHINKYGSSHTDSIVTENNEKVKIFFDQVDSSSVMHNLPTCWADGFEYGLGAEVGISTDKIHARGPVGLEGLTSQKFIVKGNSQLRGS